jgi:hypothetical protein
MNEKQLMLPYLGGDRITKPVTKVVIRQADVLDQTRLRPHTMLVKDNSLRFLFSFSEPRTQCHVSFFSGRSSLLSLFGISE